MFNHTNLVLLLQDKAKLLEFLQKYGVVLPERICDVSGEKCSVFYRKAGLPYWRHKVSGDHDFKETVTKNTVFSGSKFGLDKLMHVFYFFTHGIKEYTHLIRETSNEDCTTSKQTVHQWLLFCREICFAHLDETMEEEDKIGGPGLVVEVDETKIGKRKYKRGRRVDGQWVLGMIELEVGEDATRRGGRFRLEICPDNVRDAETLIGLIKKHVEPGTTIMSDMWAAYFGLENEGYNHLTVNHQYYFVDPNTYANTQTIESAWRPIKKEICKGGIRKEDLCLHLCDLLWKRDVRRRDKDPFVEFLKACGHVYNPNIRNDSEESD